MAATCAVVLLTGACLAQGSGQQPAVRPALLVLNNGRVVRGVITPRSGGYDVGKRTGRMFVSSQTVRFEASDIQDAYRKLRGSFSEFTPEVHIRIARWCLTNGQVASARRELLDALNLEPHNDTANSILRKMEAAVVRQERQAIDKNSVVQKQVDRLMRTEHESLGGLTDSQAGTFVGRVQPILERRCGNSSCHGSASTTDFVLKRTRGYSSRLTAERNLAVVLKYVDFRRPDKSKLLEVMDRPHSRDGRSLFPGRSGAIQETVIRDWVAAVAAKSAKAASQAATEKSNTKRSQATTGKAANQTAASVNASNLNDAEKKVINTIRASNENDPFDPAEFNRKYHGVSRRKQAANR